MYACIFKNSYIMAVIIFIALLVICNLFDFGTGTEIRDGKVVKKFSWKYPLAIALVFWLVWHFYFFPDKTGQKIWESAPKSLSPTSASGEISQQRINLANWN